jgi:hypothetical protein
MARLLTLMILVVIPTAVFAKGECDSDMEKFCKGIDKRPEMTACLEKHDSELSPECKASREAGRPRKDAK